MSEDSAEVSITKPDNELTPEQIKSARALMDSYHGGQKTSVDELIKVGKKTKLTLIHPRKEQTAA